MAQSASGESMERNLTTPAPPLPPPGEMTAWTVQRPGPLETAPLRLTRKLVPEPGPDKLLVRVSV